MNTPDPVVPPMSRKTTLPSEPVYCGQVNLDAGAYAVWVDFVWSPPREEWVVTPRLLARPTLDQELAALSDAAE